MATPAERVEPPRRRPRKGGIRNGADFRPNNRLGRAGTVQFDADVCSPVVGEVQLCYGPDVAAADKEGTQGFPSGGPVIPIFGGYIGVECFLHPDNEYEARARRALELAEDRFIEEQLWTWLVAGTGTVATSIDAAIAAAEQDADDNYVGEPVLHLSREDADLATVLLPNPVDDGKLWTRHGTPVVASGRYASGTVVISGGITIDQSDVVTRVGDDLTHNKRLAIAERVYGIIVDCDYRAEFTVTP